MESPLPTGSMVQVAVATPPLPTAAVKAPPESTRRLPLQKNCTAPVGALLPTECETVAESVTRLAQTAGEGVGAVRAVVVSSRCRSEEAVPIEA